MYVCGWSVLCCLFITVLSPVRFLILSTVRSPICVLCIFPLLLFVSPSAESLFLSFTHTRCLCLDVAGWLAHVWCPGCSGTEWRSGRRETPSRQNRKETRQLRNQTERTEDKLKQYRRIEMRGKILQKTQRKNLKEERRIER